MSSTRKLAEFPDVEAKLQKPTKKSAFERHKAEVEAKRQREAAETEAALKDFVKSFDRDGGDDYGRDSRPHNHRHDRPGGFGGGQPAYGGGGGKRHFGMPSGPQGLKSGPGSLGPAPTSFGKKRAFDGFTGRGDRNRDREADRDRDEGRGRLAFDDHEAGSRPISKIFDTSDDEAETTATDRAEEKAVSKPTLRLSSLPPGTSPAAIKALIPTNLTVEGVTILPPGGPGGTERKSVAAIVTLSPETAATDIDAAVSVLQNRYLGFGYYLSLHRHLSSAAISGSLANVHSTSSASHPFGAKPTAPLARDPSHRMGRSRGFAPPSSYGGGPGGPGNRAGILHVAVQPPRDIKKLRMIHMVIEAVLQHGPEFEALLMSRPDVQREEKWAWIWDARSEGGVWYRYRLWQVITGAKSRKGKGRFMPLFEDSAAWKLPDTPLPYEFTTGVDEFVSDSEYNSSDDDDFDDELNRQGELGNAGNDQEDSLLSPLEKAKLVHLLARLPTNLSKLRKGDIARVTAFAITHASRGADEIVSLIVSNVERPFAYSYANPDHKLGSKEKKTVDNGSHSPRQASPGPEEKPSTDSHPHRHDHSAAKLIGLYVISDILSSSSTSGIRHAWRYRQHFEAALRNRRVFEGLGLVAEKMNWGRLRIEKWKRSIGLILGHWEGWCVFPAETQSHFVNSFENPPSQKIEEDGTEGAGGDNKADDAPKKGGKWKTVDAMARVAEAAEPEPKGNIAEDEDDVGDEPYMEYTDDEDLDLEFLDEEDIDGEPLVDTGIAGLSMEDESDDDHGEMKEREAASPPLPELAKQEVKSVGGFQMSTGAIGPPKKRMRAVDMFATSDSDNE